MEWIKKNYDQFILALVALILLGLSGWLIYNAMGFQSTFAGIQANVIKNNSVPEVDLEELNDVTDSLQNPAKWEPTTGQGSLFVSIPYLVGPDGGLINPDDPKAPPLHPPVPNQWILDHHLDILDNNVLNEDPSNDGFSNLDKWKGLKGDGSDAYDPWDPKSHPPYYTKLRLIEYIKQPFRLEFNAYDGEPKKPESMDFQINTLDVDQPSQFRKIGDIIEGTKFKIIKFESKFVIDPTTGSKEDVSELTVQNTETGDLVVLVLNQIANSPDSYALFHYRWNDSQFQVKKGKEFALLPDANLRYKLIDIKEDEALIQTPTGQQVWVPHEDQPQSQPSPTPSQ
ncbi:MAG: Amuc_1099 family pilus-like system protein [Chthoniobacteraceae bacterium]|jgi:hypothetical protein